MKAILQRITRGFFLTLLCSSLLVRAGTSVWAAEPNESGAGKICGVLRSFEGEIQVFDHTRTRLGDAAFGTKLHCGDWISVDRGKATVEHHGGAALVAAENTFFQILDPQSGDNSERAHLALYRGEFVLHSAGGEVRVLTPNALGRLEKGGAFFVYSEASSETQLVGMGGQASLANRFFAASRMNAAFAKVVTFADPIERLLPDQARFVDPKELSLRLARLDVAPAVRLALEKAVSLGVKTKMPVSLATIAKSPGSLRAGGEFAATGAVRSPNPPNRAPAGIRATPKSISRRGAGHVISRDEPNFALKNQAAAEFEKKKLLQALTTMSAEDSGP